MKVLDVGSGAGDVAFLAARLVGPSGLVVGVDPNPDVLSTARDRARAAGLSNVAFVEADIRTADLPNDFDAAIGRLVLMYLADPVDALSAAATHVKPGGIVAFLEIEAPLLFRYAKELPVPTYQEFARCLEELFARAGIHQSAGFGLHRAFVEAGLGIPTMSAYAPMGGPADWPGFRAAVDTLRSILPLLENFGITTAEQLNLDTFAERLFAEVEAAGAPIAGATHVGAWARIPT
jgi:SAM-dependent methyltransferase